MYCTNTITNPDSLFSIMIYAADCITRESVHLLTRLGIFHLSAMSRLIVGPTVSYIVTMALPPEYWPWGPPTLLYNEYWLISGCKVAGGIALTTYPYLTQRLTL